MTFDIGIHLAASLFCLCGLILCIALAQRGRTTRSDAMRTAWEAWQSVSERALEKGQPVPPPPSEHSGKR